MIAEYREKIAPAEALREWTALGDEYPSNLQIQLEILRPVHAGDRAFCRRRTIERIKALTGEQGIPWRIEQSRWLLAGDPGEGNKAVSEAINLLTQVTTAARNWARPPCLLGKAARKGSARRLRRSSNCRPPLRRFREIRELSGNWSAC